MARLPTAQNMGVLPDVRSPRTFVARVSTGGIGAGGAAVGRAVSGLGAAAQNLQAQFEKQQNDQEAYDSELAFQEFKFATQNGLVSAIDTVTPDKVSGFTQQYQSEYQKNARTFLANIPESQKQRIDQKLFALERDVAVKARDFQREELGRVSLNNANTLGDKISAQARTARNGAELGDMIAGLEDLVRKDPNLNPRQKQEVIRQQAKRVGTAYLDSRAPADRLAIVQAERARRRGGGGTGSVTDRIVHVESRGKVSAKNPRSSAAGPGQFLDKTWLETVRRHRPDILEGRTDAEVLALRTQKEFRDLSIEMTERYQEDNAKVLESLGLPATPGNLYLAHFAGPGGAAKLLTTDPSRPATAVFSSAVMKANPHLKGMSVGDVVNWANNKMGGVETSALSSLTDEQLTSIANGATKQETARLKAEKKAAEKEAEDARKLEVDQLRSDVFDRKADEASVLEARKRGLFKDHKEFKSVLDYAKEVAKGEEDSKVLQDIVSGKTTYNPADKRHKKAVNEAYDRSGTNEKLVNRDEQAADGLVKLFGDLNSLPKSAAGTLAHMTRSQDKNSLVYALQTLDRIRRTSPGAFDREIENKQLQRKVEFFTTQGQFLTPDELVSRIQKMDDPIQEGIRKDRRTAADKLVKDVTPETVIEKLDLDTIFEVSDPDVAPQLGLTSGDVATAISREYKELFAEEFAENGGNADLAETMAIKQLRTKWQRSDMTGNARIMKNPPEAHLPTIEGSHEWAREDFKQAMRTAFDPKVRPATEGLFGTVFNSKKVPENISLVPVPRFNAKTPAWNVVYQDDNGEIQVLLDKTGVPYRQTFNPEPHMTKSLANFKRRRALRKDPISPETVDTIMR